MSNKSTFSQQFSELQEIVAWFESDTNDIDQALEKFERGVALAEALQKHLQSIENKVQTLRVETLISDVSPANDSDISWKPVMRKLR